MLNAIFNLIMSENLYFIIKYNIINKIMVFFYFDCNLLDELHRYMIVVDGGSFRNVFPFLNKKVYKRCPIILFFL